MPELRFISACASIGCLLLCGCSKPLTEFECDELLNRYTEKLLYEERPGVSQVEIVEKQAAARKLAREAKHFEFHRCAETVKREQFHCAMNAHDVDSMERCLM